MVHDPKPVAAHGEPACAADGGAASAERAALALVQSTIRDLGERKRGGFVRRAAVVCALRFEPGGGAAAVDRALALGLIEQHTDERGRLMLRRSRQLALPW